MKRQFIFFVSFLILSCGHNDIDYHLLIGSWKSRDVKDMPGENITDRITFFANGSVSLEWLSEGKSVQQLSASYRVEKKSKILTIIYEGNQPFNFKILKLTDKEMELQNTTKRLPERYLRY